MGGKRLSGISIKGEIGHYIPALYAVLNKAGYFEGPEYRLSCMTGMAFKFISHKRMIMPSIFMYPLQMDTWKAVDRLGIYNEIYGGNKNNPTFPLYQKKTIERVKESIDKNLPVIFWEPLRIGFGVVNGYEEEDEIFYYQDRLHNDEQIMLYNNVGRVGASSWLFQVFGERIEKDIRDIYLDSMECCVDEWEISDNVALLAKNEFVSGRKAYDCTIAALNEDNYSELGALSILNNAITSKEQVYLYFQEVNNEFDGMKEIVERYKNICDIFQRIGEIVPRPVNRNSKIDRNRISGLINYLKEAKIEEEQAVQELKFLLKEPLYNRHIDYYDVKKFV